MSLVHWPFQVKNIFYAFVCQRFRTFQGQHYVISGGLDKMLRVWNVAPVGGADARVHECDAVRLTNTFMFPM